MNITREEFKEHHDKCWRELDPSLRKQAADYLKKELAEETFDQIKELHKKDPVDWMSPYHFFSGMTFRNLLRQEIKDNKLPTGNWDDYYVAALEAAAGLREV